MLIVMAEFIPLLSKNEGGVPRNQALRPVLVGAPRGISSLARSLEGRGGMRMWFLTARALASASGVTNDTGLSGPWRSCSRPGPHLIKPVSAPARRANAVGLRLLEMQKWMQCLLFLHFQSLY